MDKWKSYFTFPVFYTAVLKDNTHLNQYDAVNVLLVGKKLTGSDETLPHITPNMTSHYARGGKPISKEIVGYFLDLSADERMFRIAGARIINKKAGATCLYRLLNSESILMDEELRQHLLQLYHYDTSAFLGEALHLSVSCPRSHLSKLDDHMIADILSYRLEDDTSDIHDRNVSGKTIDKEVTTKAKEATDGNTSTSILLSDALKDWLKEENMNQHPLIPKSAIAHFFGTSNSLCFAQKQLQLPSDKELIEKYLTFFSELSSFIPLDAKHIPEIIQDISSCTVVFITELNVPIQDLEKYVQLINFPGAAQLILFIEGNVSLLKINDIAEILQDICDESVLMEFYVYYDDTYQNGEVTIHFFTGYR